LIDTVSEVAIVGSERLVTDQTRGVKAHTTVAMDFGRMTFGDECTLFLFGTPGQRRFEVMWEILSEGMIGFILLVNAADGRSAEEAVHILEQFRRYADVPYLVGVTHLDQVEADSADVIAGVRRRLEVPDHVTVRPCDPRDREDVKSLLLTILFEVLERVERTEAAG
ncbi:MAG: GTP-binding protein, partial [Actinomycetota bacterium]